MNKLKRTKCIIIIVFLMLTINIYNNHFFDKVMFSNLAYGVIIIAYNLNYILSCVWLNIFGIKRLTIKDYNFKKIIIVSSIPIIVLILSCIVFVFIDKLMLNTNIYRLLNLIVYSVFEAVKMVILYYVIVNDRRYMFKLSDILAVVIYCLAYLHLISSIHNTPRNTSQEMFATMITEGPGIYFKNILKGMYDCVLLIYLLLSYQIRIKYSIKTISTV